MRKVITSVAISKKLITSRGCQMISMVLRLEKEERSQLKLSYSLPIIV